MVRYLSSAFAPGSLTGYDGGASATFNVQTRAGTIQYAERSDATDSPGFAALLEHTRYKLGALADQVLDGDVRVAPYRLGHSSPCNWCPLRGV